MDIQSLDRKIYEKAKAMGVKSITLSFSGGSDEGYLYVGLDMGSEPSNPGYVLENRNKKEEIQLGDEIEEWVWSVYQYSGAGDGDGYGDEIVYDLVSGTATHQDWWMERIEGQMTKVELFE
jgi:hypothetical protein